MLRDKSSGSVRHGRQPHRCPFPGDAMREFDITYDQYAKLFDGDGCGRAKTAKQAARYIRAFIKRHRALARRPAPRKEAGR